MFTDVHQGISNWSHMLQSKKRVTAQTHAHVLLRRQTAMQHWLQMHTQKLSNLSLQSLPHITCSAFVNTRWTPPPTDCFLTASCRNKILLSNTVSQQAVLKQEFPVRCSDWSRSHTHCQKRRLCQPSPDRHHPAASEPGAGQAGGCSQER